MIKSEIYQGQNNFPDRGLPFDLLWSYPRKGVDGFDNYAGSDIIYAFGENAVENFLDKNNFLLMVRGYWVIQKGYEYFANKRWVSLFSASNFWGEYDNYGAVMTLDDSLEVNFTVFKTKSEKLLDFI